MIFWRKLSLMGEAISRDGISFPAEKVFAYHFHHIHLSYTDDTLSRSFLGNSAIITKDSAAQS